MCQTFGKHFVLYFWLTTFLVQKIQNLLKWTFLFCVSIPTFDYSAIFIQKHYLIWEISHSNWEFFDKNSEKYTLFSLGTGPFNGPGYRGRKIPECGRTIERNNWPSASRMRLSHKSVCLNCCFKAQSTHYGHVEHGQLSYPHCSWPGILSGLPALSAHFCQKLTTALLESAVGRVWP